MNPRSVRVRLTGLVIVVTALLVLVAATIGVGRIEDGLVADIIDDTAERTVVVDGVIVQSGAIVGIDEIDELGAEIFVDDPFARAGESGPELDFYADELEALISDADAVGALDPLLAATGGTRASGLPLLTWVGAVAVVGIDGGGTTFLDIGPDAYDGPLASETNLQELTFALLDDEVLEATFSQDFLSDARIDRIIEEAIAERATELDLVTAVRTIDDLEFAVVADIADVSRSVDRMRLVLWTALPILTALAALLTWLLTGRALSPVRRMTDRVGVISGGSLHQRVPVPGTGDEIEALARTMNEMLGRLEADDRRVRQFVSDASHELRSPVAVLRSEADVALRTPDGTDVTELAEGVRDESIRLERIVDDLLVLARGDEARDSGSHDLIDLDDVVLAEAARRRRLPVDTGSVSAGKVRGTTEGCTRIVMHLLDNAARHAASGVAVGLVTDDDTVSLWVDDDGPGVAVEDRSRIFERFTRLESARSRDTGGAGLGLAVVADTVAAMGGTVEVEVSPSGGARFLIRWPAQS